jgi:MATE family, multidrug efflux pump
LMGAAAAVAGQNLGADRPERADKSVHIAARFGLAGAALVGFFFLFFSRQLLNVFGMDEPAVVEIGVLLLRVLSVSGLFVAVALTYTGGLHRSRSGHNRRMCHWLRQPSPRPSHGPGQPTSADLG